MIMTPFLQSVAIELVARHGNEIADYLFVLPHKRGVTYMRQYLEQQLAERMGRKPAKEELPRVVTIADHVTRISGLKRASHLQLLFTLYDAWRSLRSPAKLPSAEEFEQFRSRGETIVSDFNDVDMYGVDADALFKNLADYNNIATDYLSEEQKQVIKQYFGDADPGAKVERFWKNFNKKGESEAQFLSLWEQLAPLYHAYTAVLSAKKHSYPGLAFRQAAERVESGKFKFKAARVVYVGFNALSTMERRLFSAVKGIMSKDGGSLADFFWDAPGPALAESSPVDAARFLRRNAKDFPCSVSDMEKYADANCFPELIKEISCPGNVAQAKVISGLLESISAGRGKPYFDPARVAVVLPDEGLLFPVYYSVPAAVSSKVNLTMGYPLRHTSVASLVGLLRRLHLRARMRGGRYSYFGQDVSAILSHPLTRSFVGTEAANYIQGYLLKSRLFFVTEADLIIPLTESDEHAGQAVKILFAPLPDTDDPAKPVEHICRILTSMKAAVADGADTAPSLETVHIDSYIEAFNEFAALCGEYSMRMRPQLALAMADKLLASHTIAMQGEPLTGLQIMGMLETRALDFDYLIIPSMNERIFPRKLRARTFIPDALRIGYGIATTRFQEEIFAYHFYRLIARAKEVYLLYDASQSGLKSGDPSRYLLQLRYLLGDGRNIRRAAARFTLTASASESQLSVPKTPATLDLLAKYLDDKSGKVLSASSLKEYLLCPMKFYFSYVLNKRVDEQPEEYMGAIAIGNVLHHCMEYIYKTLNPSMHRPAVVTASQIENWLAGTVGDYASIRELAADKIREEYLPASSKDAPLPGDADITLDMLEKQIRWCLEADRRIAPFEYLESEWKRYAVFTLPDGRNVNMTMIIDRVDRITLPDGTKRLRIVDYKTGSDEISFDSILDLFAAKHDHQAIFQLMLYATLFSKYHAPQTGEPVALSIYKSRMLPRLDYNTCISHGSAPVISHLPYQAEFEAELSKRLSELFNPDTPFRPGEGLPAVNGFSSSPCDYCPYARLCMSEQPS